MNYKKLKEFDFSDTEINNLLLMSRNSGNISSILEIISFSDEKKIIKDLILLILENEPLRTISVNVKDLSIIIGLPIRKINKLRIEKKIPSIILSGTENRTGRKTYLYEVDKVCEALGIKYFK